MVIIEDPINFKNICILLNQHIVEFVLMVESGLLKINTKNNDGTIIYDINIKTNGEDNFKCNVIVKHLIKIIRYVKPKDKITLTWSDDLLKVVINDGFKNSMTSIKANCVIDYKIIYLPEAKFKFELESEYYKKTLKELLKISREMEILILGNKMLFRCIGDVFTKNVELTIPINTENIYKYIIKSVDLLKLIKLSSLNNLIVVECIDNVIIFKSLNISIGFLSN